jgi:hypothetical protein
MTREVLHVDITVYLPDETGARAKREDLNFSRILRDAVQAEFARRDAMDAALSNPQTYEFELVDLDTDQKYTGRITGKRLLDHGDTYQVFLASDQQRVLVVYPDQLLYEQIDPSGPEFASEIQGAGLDMTDAIEVCGQLGIKPVIDI